MGMGFHKGAPAGPAPKQIGTGNLNMMARALNAPSYAARGDAALATKDLGAASAFQKKGPGFGTIHDAASNAPGPKKV